MKIGGFKTPEQLEAYGEVEFFNKYPEARELAKKAMGGTPEAFNMSMPADKFFSYGVPVPPTYLQKGGSSLSKLEDEAANDVYNKMIEGEVTDVYDDFATAYFGLPDAAQRASQMQGNFQGGWAFGNQIYDPGAFANYINEKLDRDSVVPLVKPWSGPYDVTGRTPNYKNLPNTIEPIENPVGTGIDYKTLTPSNPKDYSYDGSDILRKGGSLTNRMVYPQIQSADQFFSPVYSNSNNAYAKGGNIEAFPQAPMYPQPDTSWGKTNYFMPFQKGGTFPPGMPQYTGMLPVMQTGAATNGVLTRTMDDNYHYGITPMQEGGEQGASGGMPLSRSQKFIETIQKLALKPYMKDLQEKMAQGGFPNFSPQDEEMVEPEARYGGYPLRRYQGNQGSSSVPGLGVLRPEILDERDEADISSIDSAENQNQAQVASQQAAQQAVNQQAAQDAQQAKQSQQAAVNADANTIANAKKMGWGSDVSGYINSGYGYGPGPNIYTTPKKNTKGKSNTTTTAPPVAAPNIVTTGNNTVTTTGTTGTNTGTTTTGNTTGTTGTGTTGTGTTGNTGTNTGTTTNPGATTTQSNQLIKTVDPWGRETMIIDGQAYYASGSQGNRNNYDYGYNYGYGNDYGYGYDTGWVMPGYMTPDRFWSREDARVFRDAIAPRLSDPNTQIEITPEYRNALFKKNRNKKLKSATISLTTQPGSRQSPVAQAPIIQDPGPMPNTPWKGQSQARAMFSPEMVAAMNKGAVTQSEPINAAVPRGFSGFPSTMKPAELIIPQMDVIPRGSNYNRQILSSNPYYGTEVGPSIPSEMPKARAFDRTNKEDVKSMMEYFMNNIPPNRYGGPFALPGYQPGGSVLDDDPFGGTEIMTQANPEQNMYWNTGNMDQMNQVARQIEKDSPLGKVYEMDLEGEEPGEKFDSKLKAGKRKRPKLGANATLFGLNLATSIVKNAAWNQENQDFSSALSVKGMPKKGPYDGNIKLNAPGIGHNFRPNQQNWNMRGFYAPDYGYAQAGGQQVANMGSDQYYLTQDQINKVIKAGGRVPGF